MKTTLIILALLVTVTSAYAQKIITIAPDGTPTVQTEPRPNTSVVIRSGRTTTYIGPNGTTSIVRSGGTTVVLDGR